MSILGRIFGLDKDRQDAAAKAEVSRQTQQEPTQPHVQSFAPDVQPAPEPEPRPGTRMMPEQAERMQEAQGRKPKPEAQPEPERTETATKMAYQRTPQPGPSPGGQGVTYSNPLAHQPRQSVAEDILAEARAKRAEVEAAKTPEQKLDDELQRLERPDYSRERQRWDDSRSR